MKVFKRAVLGIPFGISLGFIITIFISLGFGDGKYYPCVPVLVEKMGNEINAVILQTALCGLLGAGFAACSVIWERENWSIARQTVIYFISSVLIMMPIAYFAGWMEHSLMGFLYYFIIYAVIFVIVWLIQYLSWRKKLKKLNTKINQE